MGKGKRLIEEAGHALEDTVMSKKKKKGKKKGKKNKANRPEYGAQYGAQYGAMRDEPEAEQTEREDDEPDESGARPMDAKSNIDKALIRATRSALNQWCIDSPNGWMDTPLNPAMPDGHKFVLLERQCGNVAQALSDPDRDSDELFREAVKAGAVALAWAASLKRDNRGRRPTQWATS